MTRILTALAAAALIATAVHQPATVADDAKAPTADEAAVRALVDGHFAAIARGDAAKLEKLWDTHNARLNYLVKRGDRVLVRNQPLKGAISRWTRQPDARSSGAIERLEVVAGRMALVRVRFTWKGATYQEHLTAFKAQDGWKLVGKAFVSSEGIPAVSPYAPGDW